MARKLIGDSEAAKEKILNQLDDSEMVIRQCELSSLDDDYGKYIIGHNRVSKNNALL